MLPIDSEQNDPNMKEIVPCFGIRRSADNSASSAAIRASRAARTAATSAAANSCGMCAGQLASQAVTVNSIAASARSRVPEGSSDAISTGSSSTTRMVPQILTRWRWA